MPRIDAAPPEVAALPPTISLSEQIDELLAAPRFAANIAHVHRLPPREAVYGEWPAELAPELRAALLKSGVERPYSHQVEAIRHAVAGRNTVVVTPTASGKTVCYNVPVVQSILTNPESRALYLFPTKALSHDQYGELHDLTSACGRDIKVYTYDGDTPPATRRALRTAGHIVVTNPDMLHNGILPHHTNWIKLFENLKYVIVDELHQYRGVFGSHVANVLRRLRRICEFHGSKPTFLCSSATIANPKELAETLLEAPVETVTESGAPQGERVFVFYNPPVINAELNVRVSVKNEVRRLAARFLARGHQTIVFARSRIMVEVVTTYLKRAMMRMHKDPDLVCGYRSGYLPTERRRIEQGVRTREILGVVSTNALELGIDIGSLDISILAGWPGTVASAWQQAGRAGRKAGTSLAVLVADSSPLDQFLMSHPDYFFGSSVEQAILNPDNLAILASHLKCAAFEIPVADGEKFGTQAPSAILQYLDDQKVLRHSGDRWHYASDAYPAEGISLRSATDQNFIVLDSGDNNRVIAEVDYDSAPFLIHDHAIYIHNAKTYYVEKLDWERRTCHVRAKTVDYYTDAESNTNIQVLTVDQEEPGRGALAAKRFGDVSVATVIARFKKVKFETHESIGYGPVSVPQLEVQTEGMWYVFRPEAAAEMKRAGLEFSSGLRGLANLLRHAVPLHALCDPRDFGVSAMVRAPHDEQPTIYIYDRYPGGIGLAKRLFMFESRVLASCREMLKGCACRDGCPSCAGPPLETGDGGKRATLALLAALDAPAA